jgi:large subunit ribosomal protein L21
MYVIVDIAGQQFKVEKDQKIFVNHLEGEAGSKVDFDQVLLVDDDGKVEVGMPVIKNMVVSASILEHLQGDKVKIFKKKRRKGYQKMNGHRQSLTQILIESIGEGQARAKATPKKESEPKPAKEKKEIPPVKSIAEKPKAAVKKADAKKDKPAVKASKAATVKKAAVSKTPATKKPAAKSADPKAKKVTKKDSKE